VTDKEWLPLCSVFEILTRYTGSSQFCRFAQHNKRNLFSLLALLMHLSIINDVLCKLEISEVLKT
jgi:hypothetical protein